MDSFTVLVDCINIFAINIRNVELAIKQCNIACADGLKFSISSNYCMVVTCVYVSVNTKRKRDSYKYNY